MAVTFAFVVLVLLMIAAVRVSSSRHRTQHSPGHR